MLAGISTACFYPLYTEEAVQKLSRIPPQCVEVFLNARHELDPAYLRELRRRVCELLGGEADMQCLEDLFRQGFLSVMPMAGFAQGVSDALLSVITSRDEETSKLIFQLMLDANLAYEE